jgi:pantoate--beta-alanine ligase
MFYLLNILIQMKIILNNRDLTKTLGPFNDVGFVPTMGGIHEGHISLIKKSIKSNKKTIVSIFVNPKQFNNIKDFKTYPANIKKDLALLKRIKKLDFVYIPKFKDIYENKKKSKIIIEKKYRILCAKFRKGHFEGVLDVMNRLTKLNELNDVEKISKNFLNLKNKIKHTKSINQFLQKTKNDFERLFNIKIEYLENRNTSDLSLSNKYSGSKIFLAYYYKEVRLIDNF